MAITDHFTDLTTHGILLRGLYSELGMLPVESADARYMRMVTSFGEVREAITSSLSDTLYCAILNTDVLRIDDMVLFYELYTAINFYAACGATADVIMQQVTFPMIAKMVATNSTIAQIVKERCEKHAQTYGDLARHRMNKTLKMLNINSYIHIGNTHV